MKLRKLSTCVMLVALAALSVSCAQGRGSVSRAPIGINGKSSTAHGALANSSGPGPEEEQIKEAFLEFVAAEGKRESQLDGRVREINAVTSSTDLQAWARHLIKEVEARGVEDRELADRKWLAREDIYEPLRSLADPIGAVIIAKSAGQSRVEIIWRDIEGFWGISLGFETFKPQGESVVVRQLAPGTFVWVSK